MTRSIKVICMNYQNAYYDKLQYFGPGETEEYVFKAEKKSKVRKKRGWFRRRSPPPPPPPPPPRKLTNTVQIV